MSEEKDLNQLKEWCVVELLGHRRVGGYVTEQTIAGKGFLRIDIPRRDGTMTTQFANPDSLYCLTPTTEELARAVALENQPEPVHRWELPPARVSVTPDDHYGDEPSDNDEDDDHQPY